MKEEWRKIGHVGVDSGSLMIGDPCYFIDDNWSDEHYNQIVCGNWSHSLKVKFDKPADINSAHEGKGIIFNSGLGDGVYDVYARFTECFGRRIAEIRIDFGIEDEDD